MDPRLSLPRTANRDLPPAVDDDEIPTKISGKLSLKEFARIMGINSTDIIVLYEDAKEALRKVSFDLPSAMSQLRADIQGRAGAEKLDDDTMEWLLVKAKRYTPKAEQSGKGEGKGPMPIQRALDNSEAEARQGPIPYEDRNIAGAVKYVQEFKTSWTVRGRKGISRPK